MAEEKLVRLSDVEYYLRQTAKNMLDEAEKEAESLADDERGRVAVCVLALRTLADNAYRLPVVDAEAVVRCRECNNTRWFPTPNDTIFCDKWRVFVPCNGFCHKGAKMDAQEV